MHICMNLYVPFCIISTENRQAKNLSWPKEQLFSNLISSFLSFPGKKLYQMATDNIFMGQSSLQVSVPTSEPLISSPCWHDKNKVGDTFLCTTRPRFLSVFKPRKGKESHCHLFISKSLLWLPILHIVILSGSQKRSWGSIRPASK